MNTIYFPAHPSYFADEFTQQEINWAISQLESVHNMHGTGTGHPVPGKIFYLVNPGQSEGVRADGLESLPESFTAEANARDCANWLSIQRAWLVEEMRRARGPR
jgi:hypothetical protein